MRWWGPSLGLVALLAVTTTAEARPAGADIAAAPRQAPLVLNVRLMPADALPILSRAELLREASSLWRGGNIRLNWLHNPATQDPAGTLRVLVAEKTTGKSSVQNNRWTVGELLQFDDQRAMVVVSIGAAARVLAESRRAQFLDPPRDYDRRLGIALGRAVAHEIGHYVLHTSSHAESGLMRAHFLPDELAGASTGAFRLDDAALGHLRVAAAAGADQWIDRSRDGAFSYGSAPAGFATLEVVDSPSVNP